MVWLDSGSIPLSSTDYTGSRQTSRSRPCRLCKQRHGLRGTSYDVFSQTAGTLPAVLLSGRKGNHTTLDSNAKRVSMPRTASMSMLVSMPQSGLIPRLGSIPRGWAREVRCGRHRVVARVPNLTRYNEVKHAFHYLMHQHPRVVCPISCLQMKVTLSHNRESVKINKPGVLYSNFTLHKTTVQ